MKLDTSRLVGYSLMALVLLIEVPRFFGAYAGLDTSSLTALGTGIVLPAGAGYMLHTWWKTTRTGKNWLALPFVLLLTLEPVILVPWGMSRLWGEPLASVLGRGLPAWGWVTVIMVSPFIMTAGIVMALALQKEHRPTNTATNNKSERKSETANASPVGGIVKCDSPGCSWQRAWPSDYPSEKSAKAALSGHQKAHRNGNGKVREALTAMEVIGHDTVGAGSERPAVGTERTDERAV